MLLYKLHQMTSSSKRVDWAWGEIVFYFDGQKFYEINTNVNFQSRAQNNTVLLYDNLS